MTRLAAFVNRRARRILIVAGLFFVVAGVVGGPVAGQLSAEDEDFQDPSAENILAEERLLAAGRGREEAGLVALVPALMALLGEWNRWAPAPLRRLHSRIGLGEATA